MGGRKYNNLKKDSFGQIRYSSLYLARPVCTEWFACRDSFHNHYEKSWDKDFFFAGNCLILAFFLRKIERRLGLFWRSKVYRTNYPNVAYIKPAKFWLESKIRFSLFTLLLVAANQAKKTNKWKECLMAYPHLSESREAVEAFFSGRTEYKGDKEGWTQQFDARNLGYYKQDVDKLLVRPKGVATILQKVLSRWR